MNGGASRSIAARERSISAYASRLEITPLGRSSLGDGVSVEYAGPWDNGLIIKMVSRGDRCEGRGPSLFRGTTTQSVGDSSRCLL